MAGDPERQDSHLHDVPITLSTSFEHLSIHNCKTRLDQLPNLVLANILSRLPIKSIFRCKCVCKAWHELISEPYFADTYLATTPFVSILLSLDDELSYWLEIEPGSDHNIDDRCSIISMDEQYFGSKFNLPERTTKELVVIGSCNGLVCLLHVDPHHRHNHSLYISNLTFRECVKVLRPNPERVRDFTCGFGYVPATGKFKILRIARKKYIHKPQAEVYSIGVDDSWRDLGDAPFPQCRKICGVPGNGALHWIDESNHKGGVHLVSFNIQEENFRALPSPRGIFFAELGVLRKCLCIFDRTWIDLDIWWMKDYGDGESWTRERILTTPSIARMLTPFTTWADDILMVSRSGEIFSYGPKEEESTPVDAAEDGDCEATLYVPSFISLRDVMGKDA